MSYPGVQEERPCSQYGIKWTRLSLISQTREVVCDDAMPCEAKTEDKAQALLLALRGTRARIGGYQYHRNWAPERQF
jgi:hypothetical protein